MHGDIKISELWSLRLNPSDLYNIERTLNDNPIGGGGDTYIQVPKGQVEPLLNFLKKDYPANGVPIELLIGNPNKPNIEPEKVEFCSKSAGRMRISNQNRHRQPRLSAWLPSANFPVLQQNQTTDDARTLLEDIGGLHIYIARGLDNSVWAGFTIGKPSTEEAELPFANILWGTSRGGHWIYKENTE